MPGFDKSRFVDISTKELDEFTCGICQDVFIDPVFVQCCRQTFCKSCISQWVNQTNICPNDCNPLTVEELSSPPRFVINLLNNMKVKCDYHSKGCKIITTLEELPKHIQFCYQNPNNCTANLIILNTRISKENRKLQKKINKIKSNSSHQIQKLQQENRELKTKVEGLTTKLDELLDIMAKCVYAAVLKNPSLLNE